MFYTQPGNLGEALRNNNQPTLGGQVKQDRFQNVDGFAEEKARELESKGWRVWLTTVFPFAFEDEFSADHEKFWDLFWSLLFRIKEQQKYLKADSPHPKAFDITENEWVMLLILGRGLGKSASIEASSVMRGAILDGGYCLYVCEAQDQAEEHIGNCKILIDHDESKLSEFYPKMAINESAIVDGMKLKDRTDLFITASGWICRAKGLNARLRGLRIGSRRPDDINIDDIDGVNDSIAVSLKKLKQLTSSVIPTQARRFATIKFGQNLISETAVITQIHSGKTDALSARTVIGVTNTFVKFEEGEEYVSYLSDDGKIRYRILPEAVPTWAGVDIAQAQKFLNDSGIETFLAEYQNKFEHLKTEKVFHEYSESRQMITWSDFERLFGVRYVPQHWNSAAASDIGYSKESLSSWVFVATSAKNSPLPSHYFMYRSLTFCQDSIDDQAERLWEEMFPDYRTGRRHFEASQSFTDYPELFRLLKTKPRCAPLLENYAYSVAKDKYVPQVSPQATDEDKALFYVNQASQSFRSQIVTWRISHEKTGEQKTLAQKYGIPIRKTKKFGADAGLAEANHLLRGDYTRPHPFYEDELDETGLYRLGCPFLFFIVDDDQLLAPRDDAGMRVFREQVANQRWTQEKITESGITKTIPMKFQADSGDALRIWAADYNTPSAASLTIPEQREENLPSHLQSNVVAEVEDEELKERLTLQRMIEFQKMDERERKNNAASKTRPNLGRMTVPKFRR